MRSGSVFIFLALLSSLAVQALPKEPATNRVRVRLIVPKGTLLPVEFQTTLSTATCREGDPIIALLTGDVPLGGFKLDKGAEVRGEVKTVISAKQVKGGARLVLDFDSVMKKGDRLSIITEPIDTMARGGHTVGAIKDGKKGVVAGTGAVVVMKGGEIEIPRGARLSVKVTR